MEACTASLPPEELDAQRAAVAAAAPDAKREAAAAVAAPAAQQEAAAAVVELDAQ